MSSKIIKLLLIVFFSISVMSTANAGLIVGDLYADDAGIQWEYVGFFDLADGPDAFGIGPIPTSYNGVDAAVFLFPELLSDQVAISSNDTGIVNHQAWYDTYLGFLVGAFGIIEKHESVSVTLNNVNGLYDEIGDTSAFVNDRSPAGDNINYVFKLVSVPEPSSIAIFGFALIAFSVRRFKK
ncbi:PEP-CTERM sorting domain-containing protein [Cognaticolwellia mytili]|uniref:PEP-CTERM sorting domain-containing protein n=1 Tax=Cognaticolwellia mytili TaxID=1888913 RepID=UPI000A17187B|nr:PEP-CTERM sorting domain-containing protein [Cognaticolwellia mytili]